MQDPDTPADADPFAAVDGERERLAELHREALRLHGESEEAKRRLRAHLEAPPPDAVLACVPRGADALRAAGVHIVPVRASSDADADAEIEREDCVDALRCVATPEEWGDAEALHVAVCGATVASELCASGARFALSPAPPCFAAAGAALRDVRRPVIVGALDSDVRAARCAAVRRAALCVCLDGGEKMGGSDLAMWLPTMPPATLFAVLLPLLRHYDPEIVALPASLFAAWRGERLVDEETWPFPTLLCGAPIEALPLCADAGAARAAPPIGEELRRALLRNFEWNCW